MTLTLPYNHIAADGDLSEAAARFVHSTLEGAIAARGTATLMVSGGSSPLPMYEHLSKMPLAWDKVRVGLVDERWVDESSDGSNTRAIREHLLINEARVATFKKMTTDHENPEDALTDLEDRFSEWGTPFDLCIMGMGSDSHTASWFPNSQGLEKALDESGSEVFAAIDATGCSGAGKFPARITLSLTAVLNARTILLYIPGSEKAKVFEARAGQPIEDAPVNALRHAGSRLTIFSGKL